MNRHVKALTVLLALQLLVLAGILVWQQRATTTQSGVLLPVERSRIDGVTIVDEKGQKVQLQRGDSGWTLPEAQGLPVDPDKITQLLDRLIAASAPWPIATSAESAKRFEVTPEKFQRQVQLLAAGQVIGDLYLGTSPGFKKVHARRADSDDVYAIDFANYDAPARADDWLDKALLKPAGDVTAVAWPEHWRIQRSGDAWVLEGLAPGESTKQDAVTDLVNKIANLRVSGVADAPPVEGSSPALTLTVSTSNGEFDYRLYQPQPSSDFIVARSGQEGFFKLAAYIGEPLMIDRVDLLTADASVVPAPAAASKPAIKATTQSATKPTKKPAAR